MSSPWWYRFRSAVFALIYLAGFIGGSFVSGHPYRPAYTALGAGAAAPLLGAACFFTVASLAIRAWGASYLSAAVVWHADALTDALVVAGPFRYTRNPLYLGNVLLALGFALLAPVPGAAFIVIANVAFIAALMRHEETLMSGRYGAAFGAYCAQVPRLFPRLIPAAANSVQRPHAAQGILSELFTACIAAGLFAWILAPPYGAYAFFFLYAAGALAQRAVERGQRS